MKKIVIYDFDGTLTPYPIPSFKILKKCGLHMETSDVQFLEDVKNLADEKQMNLYQAMFETYLEVIKKAGFSLTDDHFSLGSDEVEYNKGVPDFLTQLKNHHIDNYLLSSGLKAYLDRISIAPLFKKIYGTTFEYDENKEAIGVAHHMSDKRKVGAIKEINLSHGKSEKDCSDVIYVGDGLTDLYAMEFVSQNGGTSICVYQDEKQEILQVMKEKKGIHFFAESDYTPGSKLYTLIMKECNIKG